MLLLLFFLINLKITRILGITGWREYTLDMRHIADCVHMFAVSDEVIGFCRTRSTTTESAYSPGW